VGNHPFLFSSAKPNFFRHGRARAARCELRSVARLLRVAALQLRAHDASAFTATLPSLLDRVRGAAREADLLVLPEGTLPAYVLGGKAIDEASVARALADLSAIAARERCAIVVGAAVRRDGALYNTAVVIDCDGTPAGSAEKIFLWHFDRKWFAPGDRLAPVATSIGKLGVLVCADGRMPGIARALVDRGAELLVMPTAWVTSGRDPAALENAQADLLARVRAFENAAPFVAANKCGVELGMVAYCGKSQIVDANGEILALAGERDEVLIDAQIALKTPHPQRVARALPPAREPIEPRTIRVALSARALPPDIEQRLETIDAEVAIAPGAPDQIARLDRSVPTIVLDANAAFDPGTLALYRAAGYRVAVLEGDGSNPWLERIARARALELRMYVVAIDLGAGRAYAVDPDGAIVAGTFGDYRIASFPLDVHRTLQTSVAPGTDVAEGIARVGEIVRA
jgi:predicted amidohydrolase